jgi:hypothetical protein
MFGDEAGSSSVKRKPQELPYIANDDVDPEDLENHGNL